jgi:hypothetical protein
MVDIVFCNMRIVLIQFGVTDWEVCGGGGWLGMRARNGGQLLGDVRKMCLNNLVVWMTRTALLKSRVIEGLDQAVVR